MKKWNLMRWQNTTWVAILIIVVFTVVVGWKQKRGGACYEERHPRIKPGSLLSGNANSGSYFCALIAPANLPADYLVLIGIGGVLVAISTLKSIHHQAVQVRKQTRIFRDSAEAALLSAQAVIASERAWILVETGNIRDDFEPKSDYVSFLEVRPVIGNYGKTPARIERIGIRAHQIPAETKLPKEPQFARNQIAETNIMLPPGELRIQPAKVQIPISDFTALRTGDPILYIYGFVEYTDLGKESRKTNFCFVYHIPHGFTSLNRGWYTPGDVPKAYTECK